MTRKKNPTITLCAERCSVPSCFGTFDRTTLPKVTKPSVVSASLDFSWRMEHMPVCLSVALFLPALEIACAGYPLPIFWSAHHNVIDGVNLFRALLRKSRVVFFRGWTTTVCGDGTGLARNRTTVPVPFIFRQIAAPSRSICVKPRSHPVQFPLNCVHIPFNSPQTTSP